MTEDLVAGGRGQVFQPGMVRTSQRSHESGNICHCVTKPLRLSFPRHLRLATLFLGGFR
jgi:hypothetical protein